MKFKVGDEVKIISKSVRSDSINLIGKNGWIVEFRYNGRICGYKDDFYYAVGKRKITNYCLFHFLEHDLKLLTENEMDVFKWMDFKI